MNHSSKYIIGIIFLFTLIISADFFLQTTSQKLRTDNDYDSTLPVYIYPIQHFKLYGKIPFTNPYVATGISTLGDLQSPVFNPIFFVIFYFLSMDIGMKLMFSIVLFLNGITMWRLLNAHTTNISTRIFGSLLYMTNGAIYARFFVGHVEFFITTPLIPLFLYYVLKEEKNKPAFILGCLLAISLFSGNIYFVWMFILLLLVKNIFILSLKRNFLTLLHYNFVIFGTFLLISSPKIFFFILYVLPVFTKFFPLDPFSGSVYPFQFLFSLILPVTLTNNMPTLTWSQNLIYDWHEYYNFISIIPFVFILGFKRYLFKNKTFLLMLILLVVLLLYAGLGYSFSPFFILFKYIPFLSEFRVPARIIMISTPIIIYLLSIGSEHVLINKNYRSYVIFFIYATAIIINFSYNRKLLFYTYTSEEIDKNLIVNAIPIQKNNQFYIANFVCCLQRILLEHNFHVLNYYYGWRPKNTPNFIDSSSSSFYNFSMLNTYKPTLVIVWQDIDLSQYSYSRQNIVGDIVIWKSLSPNIFPSL